MIKDQGFDMLLASPHDYQRLVAEIYYDGKFLALVSHERSPDEFDVETPGVECVQSMVTRKVDLQGFIDMLEKARQWLAGRKPERE